MAENAFRELNLPLPLLNFCIDVFSMSSCVATSRLVHDGGYIQNCYNFSIHLKFCDFGRLYFVTKVLLNLDRFHTVLATMQRFIFWKSAIMDQFLTCRKRVYKKVFNFILNLKLSDGKIGFLVGHFSCPILILQRKLTTCRVENHEDMILTI